jgi:hypothetical protein
MWVKLQFNSSAARVTPGSGNPSRAYGQKHQSVTAGMVHVTNPPHLEQALAVGAALVLGERERLVAAHV